MQPNWKKMFLLSFLIHLGVFLLVFFIPESAPTRLLQGVIYEVNLVELPRKTKMGGPVTKKKGVTSKKGIALRRTTKRRVRRIGRVKTKEKAVVIAKKVIKRKKKRVKKLYRTPDKVLKEALAKLEKKVEREKQEKQETAHVESAIKKIEKEVETSRNEMPGSAGVGAPSGITLQIYKMEVESRIKSNWAYPVGIADENKRKGLEAIVILTVKHDGTISEYRFKKKSRDPFFDESVTKAIERSNPLPPFPEGFLKSYEEIEINFNLSEFETAGATGRVLQAKALLRNRASSTLLWKEKRSWSGLDRKFRVNFCARSRKS